MSKLLTYAKPLPPEAKKGYQVKIMLIGNIEVQVIVQANNASTATANNPKVLQR